MGLIQESIDNIIYHHKAGNILYINVWAAFIITGLGVWGMFLIPQCKWQTLVLTFLLYCWCMLGVTAGAHRLWSHHAYKASYPLRFFIMVGFAMANQNSILQWAEKHRAHHKYSDQDGDPYDASRGFFYAHLGWLLIEPSDKCKQAKAAQDMSDLHKDPVVMLEASFPRWFKNVICYVVPALMTKYICGDSFTLGLLVPGAFRYVANLHATFAINSFAHLYGDRPYDINIWPRENIPLNYATLGDGWHNWHHKYPYDYAGSEYGILTQFNFIKAFLDFFALFGMVTDRKRALGAWALAKKKRVSAASSPSKSGSKKKAAATHLSELKSPMAAK